MTTEAQKATASNKTFFTEKVDLRSRKAMTDFLSGHYRYDTMSSLNRSTSYANRVKLYKMGLTREQEDAAYELLDVEDGMPFVDTRIREFTRKHNGYYTVSANGRSGGYLVLYNSCYKPSEYKSICACCGQRNYREVFDLSDLSDAEQKIAREVFKSHASFINSTYLQSDAFKAIDLDEAQKVQLLGKWKALAQRGSEDRTCGVCRAKERVPYQARELAVYAGQSIDAGESFEQEEWSLSKLRERVKLVMSFDAMCDAIRNDLIRHVARYTVATKTVKVTKQVKVLKRRSTATV